MTGYQATTLKADGQLLGEEDIVILEPEAWVGERFPLLPYIDVGDQLLVGQWRVLLYHHDCPKCQEKVGQYLRAPLEAGASLGQPRVALLEMPPYGAGDGSAASGNAPCLFGRLDETRDWFAVTPIEFQLNEGKVALLIKQ